MLGPWGNLVALALWSPWWWETAQTHTQGHAATWEGVSPSCTQQTGVLKERLAGQRMRQGPALGSSRLLRNMRHSKRILLGGGFRRRELQTQRQRHVGRKHGFCLSCKSFPVAGGAASRMLTNGRHRGLSVIPEGRAWKPFRITASSQKGDHVRVHVRVRREVVQPKVTPILANPYPTQEALL